MQLKVIVSKSCCRGLEALLNCFKFNAGQLWLSDCFSLNSAVKVRPQLASISALLTLPTCADHTYHPLKSPTHNDYTWDRHAILHFFPPLIQPNSAPGQWPYNLSYFKVLIYFLAVLAGLKWRWWIHQSSPSSLNVRREAEWIRRKSVECGSEWGWFHNVQITRQSMILTYWQDISERSKSAWIFQCYKVPWFFLLDLFGE